MRACTEETTRKAKNQRTLRATGKNAEMSVLKRTGTCSRMRTRSEAEARYTPHSGKTGALLCLRSGRGDGRSGRLLAGRGIANHGLPFGRCVRAPSRCTCWS